MSPIRKPKLAVWKFASCAGCQLTLLDCEDELLAIAGPLRLANFAEATSTLRRAPGARVTLPAYATAGGIQALRNSADVAELAAVVYARPDYLSTPATSTP